MHSGDQTSLYSIESTSPGQTATQLNRGLTSLIDWVMEPEYTKVGSIEHFYSKAGVAIVQVSAPIKKGDKILIRGSTTNLPQIVESMEVEHKQMNEAQAGQKIGLKVAARVRENDVVYKVAEG